MWFREHMCPLCARDVARVSPRPPAPIEEPVSRVFLGHQSTALYDRATVDVDVDLALSTSLGEASEGC